MKRRIKILQSEGQDPVDLKISRYKFKKKTFKGEVKLC